jgi:hypothetical protein
MPCGCGIRSVIVTIEVAAPLALLNGGATAFSRATVLKLGPEVGGGKACRCTPRHRCAPRYRRVRRRQSTGQRWGLLWGPMGVVGLLLPMKWHVEGSDDEVVNVIAPLLCCL